MWMMYWKPEGKFPVRDAWNLERSKESKIDWFEIATGHHISRHNLIAPLAKLLKVIAHIVFFVFQGCKKCMISSMFHLWSLHTLSSSFSKAARSTLRASRAN